MLRLMILLAISLALAYCSQNGVLVFNITKKYKLDLPLILMILILAFACGLRTSFNDTEVYLATFKNAETLREFINTSPSWTEYPLFDGYMCFFRHNISANGNAYFVSIALFSLGLTIPFIKRHSDDFMFSIVIFFSLGLYVSHMAAMKQCMAIAVLTLAIEALMKKKILLYYIIVFVAVLFHTYAVFFFVLPFFTSKPWTLPTYLLIGATIFALIFFESAINTFLSAADSAGKYLSKEMVLDNGGINPLRLAVFSVPPLLSFAFQEQLENFYDRKKNILISMSILSFLIMSLGLFSAANLFGRSAIYFELGTIVVLPALIKEIFDRKTARFVSSVATICYLGFFAYSLIGFEAGFRTKTFIQFVLEIFN